MDFLVLKEIILLWCSQPPVSPKTNITQQIFLFDHLAWKHGSAQIIFATITIRLNEMYFLLSARIENFIQCTLWLGYSVFWFTDIQPC